MTKWDQQRCLELEQFELLLRELSSINSGSHCLERIERCIALGEALNEFNLDRMNFNHFLRSLAIDDRSK